MPSQLSGPHGVLLLDKPQGITSHDLVARTRKALQTRKVGHAGTLDPMATGLMLLGVGDATRLLTYLVGADKTYEATVRLGQSTNTEDADGELTGQDAPDRIAALDPAAIRAAAASFLGDIEQVPSAVSAIKIDGKRAYQRVREGEDVVLPARSVTIHEIEVLGIRPERLADADDALVCDVDLRVRCSSGTYVRALGRDLGSRLGVGAHLTALRRTAVGPFRVRDCVELDSPDAAAALISPSTIAAQLFPHFTADAALTTALRHGQRATPPSGFDSERGPIAALDPHGDLIGLVEVRGGRTRTLLNMPHRPEETP